MSNELYAVHGPPARLFRLVYTSGKRGYRVDTWDRHAGHWRLWGYQNGYFTANVIVASGRGCWVESLSLRAGT
jgi:hypothetical protein